MFVTRWVLRTALIGGIALGVAAWAFPNEAKSVFAQVKTSARDAADKFVDDPVALRRQLEKLAGEYPERIAEVRGEIAEVEHQLGEIGNDVQIARRVVAMTTDDLQQIKTLVAKAEAAQQAQARPASIRFEGVLFDLDEAYSEAHRINNVRESYKNRLAYDNQQHEFLTEQKARLVEILDKLEKDFNTYQTQLWALDRQIDAIERNERLIELTEEQQATLREYEKFGKVGNLKQLESRLAELRTVQEAQLQALRKRNINRDYEERAEYEMQSSDIEGDSRDIFDEIELDDDEDDDDEEIDRSIAFAPPIVIE